MLCGAAWVTQARKAGRYASRASLQGGVGAQVLTDTPRRGCRRDLSNAASQFYAAAFCTVPSRLVLPALHGFEL